MQTRLFVLTALLAGTALGAFAQERIKPKGVADYDSVYAAVGEHWKAERWGKCYATARELMALISQRRSKEIRKAMPVPEGLQAEPIQENDPQANAMIAAFAAGVGTVTEQVYTGPGKRVRITVTADSPMLQMFQMIVQNPAMLQKNQELIKYSECSAILESEGRQVTLRFLLNETLVEGEFEGFDSDSALKIFDQAAVSRLHKVIVN